MSTRSVVRAAFFMSLSPTNIRLRANGSPAFPFRSGSKEVHVMTKWPLPSRRGFGALVPKWRRVCRRALNDFARETFTGRAEDSASRHNHDGSSDFTHAGAVLRQLEIPKISEPRDSTPSSSAVNTTEMESRRPSLSRVIVLRGRLVERRRQAVQAIPQIGSFLDERCGYLRV
jgi:hypothetical protein